MMTLQTVPWPSFLHESGGISGPLQISDASSVQLEDLDGMSAWEQVIDVPIHIAVCDGITDMLSQLFNVSSAELRSPTRSSKPVARVRQIGMYVAHVGLSMTMSDIADGFGRDRSTVTHACNLIEDMRDDDEMDAIVSKIEALVRIAFRLHLQKAQKPNQAKDPDRE